MKKIEENFTKKTFVFRMRNILFQVILHHISLSKTPKDSFKLIRVPSCLFRIIKKKSIINCQRQNAVLLAFHILLTILN